jgi:DNA polymerase epsilon subunit 3
LSRSGKSITASDIIKAIIEMDFGPADNLVPLLEQELAGMWHRWSRLTIVYRSNTQASKTKAKPTGPGRGKPRKSNADTTVEDEEESAEVRTDGAIDV